MRGSCSIQKRKVVFLDRDGVLCRYDEFTTALDQFHLLPGIGPAVHKLNSAGFLVSLATNQPLVARGRLPVAVLEQMHQLMSAEVQKAGGHFDFMAYCPHDPGPAKNGYVAQFVQPCDCRKPSIGMITQAVRHFEKQSIKVDLRQSWMIGDSWRDLVLAQNAGLQAVAIAGVPSREHESLQIQPRVTVADLPAAVDFILSN